MKLQNKIIHIFSRIYRWFQKILGNKCVGVRALVFNNKDQILLVKHTYTPGWYLPGGGVDRGESTHDANIRELWEEAGVRVQKKCELFNVYYHDLDGLDDYIVVYVVKDFTQEQVRSIEIEESAWFDLHNLPENILAGMERRIEEYLGKRIVSYVW